MSQSHRIPEPQHGRGWKGPLWVTSPTPCPSRVTQSRLHSTVARRGWNISREGEAAAGFEAGAVLISTLLGSCFLPATNWGKKKKALYESKFFT